MDAHKPVQIYANHGTHSSDASKSSEKKPIVIEIKRAVLTTKKAVELLLKGTLKSTVCRYCLHITAPLSEIDQILQIADKGVLYQVTIRDIVASFYPFKVIDDPNLPKKICEKCLDKAIQSYRFAQQCEQAGRALRNCLDDMYEKLEKLDPLEKTKKRGRQKLHPNYNTLYTEHRKVMDYAEPVRNLINTNTVSFTSETQMGELECKKCWQVLPNVESLANHEKIHPKTMWFNCRTCGKAFAKKLQMKRHLRQHAKEKPNEAKPTDFVCKQCGYTTENHNLHLQHIETHKFQKVIEHVVERKMDKLCSVCFSGNRKMVEMDKMICLHGGYPELTGDRTLYNILGATVPEPNYKYQELMVSYEPKIMKLVKKVGDITEQQTKEGRKYFVLSLPKIISRLKTKNSDTYYYRFSEPLKTLDFKKIMHQEPPNLMEDVMTDERDDQNFAPANSEKNKTTNYTFSMPDYSVDINNVSKETIIANCDETGKNTKICAKCWVFKKPSCIDCIGNEEEKINSKITHQCQNCWLFKESGKCDFCKKLFEIEEIRPETENIERNISPQNCIVKNNDTFDSKKATKYKLVMENTTPTKQKKLNSYYEDEDNKTAKLEKWQCKICLTTNSTERKSCLCCQYEEVNNAIKLNLSNNDSYFLKNIHEIETKINEQDDTTNENKIVINHDINQNDLNVETENPKNYITEIMEISNSPTEFQSSGETLQSNYFEETMEVSEEDHLSNNSNMQVVIHSKTDPAMISLNTCNDNDQAMMTDLSNITPDLDNCGDILVASNSEPETVANFSNFNVGVTSKSDMKNQIRRNSDMRFKRLRALRK